MKGLVKTILRRQLNENQQQADKLYYNTGKLPKEAREAIFHITNGDATTRLVTDLVYHFQNHGGWQKALPLGEQFHKYLLAYDKNVFPVKYNLDDYNQTDNEKHVIDLYSILKERYDLVNEFRKLPSIAIRNLQGLKKTVGEQEYLFKSIYDKVRRLNSILKTIPENDRTAPLREKIFNSKNGLDDMLNVAEHYQHAFTGVEEEQTKEDILEQLEYVDADLVQDSNNVLVIRINSQEAMQTIGCTSLWCFSRPNSMGYWYDYASQGFVYIIFDFNKSPHEATFMMVLLPNSWTLYVSTNVLLADVGIEIDDSEYMKSIGVDVDKIWADSDDTSRGEREEYPEDDEDEEPVQKEKPKKVLQYDPNQLSLFETKNFIRESIRLRLMEQRIKHDINIPSDILAIKDVFKSHGYKLYVVGGAVRDALLGKVPKDFDLATDAVPDKVEQMMASAGFRTLPTGKAFGVINVFTDQGEYEIATFRNDLSGGRRPDAVKFTDIENDVKRRDLTINALFYDLETREIVDLVGGVEDLKHGVIKTVGSPQERFNEDRLRILRAIRFAGRFGSALDPQVDQALLRDASLEGISGERIRDEFIKGIQSAKSVRQYLSLIEKYKLFDWIFRGLRVNTHFIENKDVILVIATLLKDNDPTTLNKHLNGLKYTIDEIRAISFLVNLLKLSPETAITLKRAQKVSGVTDEQIKSFGSQEGIDSKLLDAFIKFKLTVNGEEVMRRLGLKPGKELGDAINKAEYDNFMKLS